MKKTIISSLSFLALVLFSTLAFASDNSIKVNCYNQKYNIKLSGILDLTNHNTDLDVSVGWEEIGQKEIFKAPRVLQLGAESSASRLYYFKGIYSGGPFEVGILANPRTLSLDSVFAFDTKLTCITPSSN